MGVQLGNDKGKGAKPNINVTPLVDVVLVLLIIFMVVLPDMNDEGKTIAMTQVQTADEPDTDGPEPLIVTIDKDKVYSLGDDDLPRDACLEAIKSQADASTVVMLRGDAAVPYGEIRDFFAQLQEMGFKGVKLAVGARREMGGEGAEAGAVEGEG